LNYKEVTAEIVGEGEHEDNLSLGHTSPDHEESCEEYYTHSQNSVYMFIEILSIIQGSCIMKIS
jgi:hypothetical protein